MASLKEEKRRSLIESPETDLVVSLAETLSSFSFALDLTEDAIPGHALRSCLIGMRLGAQLRLDRQQMFDLYYALLLKDVGCSSNASRMCQIMGGGDDRAVKSGVKLEDWTQPHKPKLSAIKLLWNNLSPGAGPIQKTWQLIQLGRRQHQNNAEMISLRCDRGASIVRKIGLTEQSAEGVRCLDEHWDGGGYSQGLRGHDIPIISRIACLAQHLDVFAAEQSPLLAIETMNERSGRWFDPELVRVANLLDKNGSLWVDCWSPGNVLAMKAVMDLAPSGGRLTTPGIDHICEAFAEVVDAKSSFTFRHSVGVTNVARDLALAMGLGKERAKFVYRAALLHDLGKLRVPNSILDKNGRPNSEEWAVIQEHPALTRQILQRIDSFGDLAYIAGAHHEKLDGSGYPDRLEAADMPVEARILAVSDIYAALTEERPYRHGSQREEALAIIKREVPHRLDADCYDALVNMTRDLDMHAVAEHAPQPETIHSGPPPALVAGP